MLRLVVVVALVASGCASHARTVMTPQTSISGPKKVTVVGPGYLVDQIEEELRPLGFKVGRSVPSTLTTVNGYVFDVRGVCPNITITGYELHDNQRVMRTFLDAGIECPGNFFREFAQTLNRAWIEYGEDGAAVIAGEEEARPSPPRRASAAASKSVEDAFGDEE